MKTRNRRRLEWGGGPGIPGPVGPLALTALLVAGACGPPHRDWKSSLDLADFVAHQRQNLSTETISTSLGTGLDDIGSGWRLREDEEGAPVAEMRRQLGRLRVYSPEADLASVELELGLSPADEPGPVRVNVHLNRQSLADLDVSRPWSTYRMEVPAAMVRPGLNVLDVWHMERSRTQPSVRLRRVRLLSRRGRPLWPERPDTIRVRDVEVEGAIERRVEMPTASYLDMVLRVPEGAYLAGGFSVERAPGEDAAVVDVSVGLLDESGEEQSLLHEQVEGALAGSRKLGVDLAGWAGELVRLRWTVTGAGNALVRWHGARVLSTEPRLEPPSPPIRRVAPGRSGRLGRPDVIVILLDAARADVFSPFGGPHETPAVARLAADGTVFRSAVAGSSWTLPSVSAMLTGLHADTLGVGAWEDRLPDEVPTLPELMTSAGYRSVLFSQHPFYAYETSFKRGFKRFRALRGKDTTELPRRRELMARNSKRRTFALVHLLPPHTPYTPPPPFRGRYTADYTGDMKVDATYLNSFHPTDSERPDEDDVDYVRGRYLENVAYADSLVGRVLKRLDQHGRYDDTLVVLLADHGEAFMEHGRFLHSQNVHRELLHVPLVVKWPASVTGFRRVVDDPVSLLDLLPTLVDGLALDGAADGFQGRSFLPLAFGEPGGERSFYAVTRGANGPNQAAMPQLMLESGGWRVHSTPLLGTTELYDVSRDPLETRDLASEQPLQALLLLQSLQIQSAWNRELLRKGRPGEAGGDLDADAIEQLEALGYLN
ncbi:MAG: sulfatase [Acidobacteria bacterium]|nr:sulfatase [Acidobacteriota bacterium]